jgi:hypothetical protein
MDQMGESGIKKIAERLASSTESIESNLLMFNPKLSYPADEWVKADPGFWKPTPAAQQRSRKPNRRSRRISV